jgi:hypothetical protein
MALIDAWPDTYGHRAYMIDVVGRDRASAGRRRMHVVYTGRTELRLFKYLCTYCR